MKGKGKGKNDGCFICGSRDHWASNCPRAYTQGALWQIDEGNEWSEDWNTDWNQEQQIGENGENADWNEYQGALYDDSAWTEDDWYGDWWYDDSYDWSSDWSWHDDSFWQPSNWITEGHRRNRRLLPQSLPVHQDWQVPATLLMRVSLLPAARATREAQALREHRAQVLRVSCSLEH